MARYLVERTFFVDEAEMSKVGQRSREIITGEFPEIIWEHSHVVLDPAGKVRTYCVYAAPGEEPIRRHAELLGQHQVDSITEIIGDVTPKDFPSS